MGIPSPTEIVTRLCSFEGRGAGTDAERRAAGYLAETLRSPGRQVDVEPTYVHPQWPWVHAIHCLIGIAGSLLVRVEPAIGFGLVLAAASLMYLDLGGRAYVVRSLLFRRASQNVVARDRDASTAERPLLIICANYDAPRSGAIYGRRPQRILAALERSVSLPLGGLRLPFFSLALLLPLLGARMAGLESSALTAAQLPPTLILIASLAMLAEIGLSPIGPGANENASGTAAAITAFDRLSVDPPKRLGVALALIGGGETSHEGLRSLLKAHRRDLSSPGTYYVHLDSVGKGSLRYTRGEGPLVSIPSDPRLLATADALAFADDQQARPMLSAFTSGSHISSARGCRSVAISARDESEPLPIGARSPEDQPPALSPATIGSAVAFTVDLVHLLDRDLARVPHPAASD